MRHVAMLLCALAVALTGCSASYLAPVRPPAGGLFTSVSAPLSVNFKETPVCTKVGTASTCYFHDWLITGMDFAWGDAGVEAAMMNGNLSTVEYADYDNLMVLWIFGRFTVRAYGK